VAHPDRIAGVLCIDALGAEPGIFVTFEENRDRTLTAGQIARIHAIEERRRSGEVGEAELLERFALSWPAYFHDPERASAPPERVGRKASIETNRSLGAHFERQTLIRRLPEVRAPALFVHGESDPLPPESSTVTAALIPGALVETIPEAGHFPWLDQPAGFRSAVEGLLARVRA
jgi:proline iminopeptidase